MNLLGVLAAAGAVVATTPVAATVYDFTFSSTGHAEWPGCGPPWLPTPPSCQLEFPFSGTVRVETTRAGDGFFTGADLVGVSFTWRDFGPVQTLTATGFPTQPFFGAASASVLDGEVVAIHAWFEFPPIDVGVSGMTAFYSHVSRDFHAQAMAPLIPAIPEPSTAVLLAAGLLGLAAHRRRKEKRVNSS